MRRPSARCTPNQVTLKRANFAADSAGGKIPSFPSPSTPFNVSIQPSESEMPDPQGGGHGRQTLVTSHDVISHDDLSLTIRDQILWGSRVLTVVGVLATAAGRGRTWTYKCVERP